MLYFFFNDTATTEIYTLSLHDALPIFGVQDLHHGRGPGEGPAAELHDQGGAAGQDELPRRVQQSRSLPGDEQVLSAERGRRRRSEEHTSELQSRQYLVCRLLLEKKKKI